MGAWNSEANEIFLKAVEIHSISDRRAFLDEACQDKGELRAQVVALLEASERAGSFLESPPAAYDATVGVSSVSEGPGTAIGPYKLLQQIGEGGFGVVFMAEQHEPVRRKVALKILKPGMDTRQVVARFEAERQALAIMDHPNIAKVFDGGATESGRPYFVMELVKGVPITMHCDEHQLTTRQRLELFISVCCAVQHAHQKGIIHRDLKPSNVLITMHDTIPVVKVIDFGVAKALGQELTDKTLFTGFDQLIGTPLYMSPEQAGQSGLDIDTRSDIYSLGVLLYELLTGTTPFDKQRFQRAAYDEICRIIREEDPPKPSTRLWDLGRTGEQVRRMSTPSDKSQHLGTASSPTEHVSSLATLAAQRQTEPAKLTKLLRGDLDWVVMKALEKERNRRFETASGLAMDLRRYLADEPVQASPPSAGYRLRKMIRRNKGPVVAVGLVSFALLGGVIGTTWGMLAARRSAAAALEEAAEKDVARKQAVEQRERAEKAERAARADRDRAISAEKAALAEASEKEKARDQAVSERGRAEAAELDAKRDRDRAVDAEADTKAFSLFLVRNVLAVPRPEGVAGGQGIDVTMSQALEAAEQDIERVFAERPKAEAEARHTIGMTWLHLGRYTKAEQHLRRVVQLRERFLGPTDLDTLISRDVLSIALVHAGRGPEAVPLCEVTLDQLCKTVGPDHPETLNCMNNLGRAYDAVGRVSESLALLKRSNDQHHKILGHDHRNTLISMSNLGLELLKTGQLEEAIQLLQSVLDLRIKKIGPDHPETLIAMNNLASAFRDAGQWQKAATLYEETLRNKKKKFGPDHPSTFLSMHNLAHVYAAEERVTEAQPLSDVAVNGLVSKLGPAHPWTKAAQNAQRSIRELQMRLEKYNQTLSANGLDHLDTLASREQLAYALRNLSNPAAAEVHMRAVYEGRRRTLGAEDRRTLSSKLEIGYLQNLQRKHGDAESTLRDVLAIYTKSSPDLWVTFVGKSLLGASLLEQRKYAEAEPLLVEGYEGMHQREATIPAPIRRSRILQALERIVRLYGAWDQKDKLNEWSKKLEQLNQELANQEQEPETASSSPSP